MHGLVFIEANQWPAAYIREIIKAMIDEEAGKDEPRVIREERLSFAWAQLLAASLPAGEC